MSKTSTVDSISPAAKELLDAAGVRIKWGYGDVYHFYDFFTKDHQISIPDRFLMVNRVFVVCHGRLQLLSEVDTWYVVDETEESIEVYAIDTPRYAWAVSFTGEEVEVIYSTPLTEIYVQVKYKQVYSYFGAHATMTLAGYKELLEKNGFIYKDEVFRWKE